MFTDLDYYCIRGVFFHRKKNSVRFETKCNCENILDLVDVLWCVYKMYGKRNIVFSVTFYDFDYFKNNFDYVDGRNVALNVYDKRSTMFFSLQI